MCRTQARSGCSPFQLTGGDRGSGLAPVPLVTLDNLGPIAWPLQRRRFFQMSALSTFDGTLGAYHGDHR